jgi:hypothetical protein
MIWGVLYLSGCASGPVIHLTPAVLMDNMKETVKFLTSLSPPRNHANPDALRKVADYIASKFDSYGLQREFQAYQVDGKEYVNVIASMGPKGDNRLIIGAHYDVFGNLPGADDNASGIAGLLEIARFLKSHESELSCGVDIVAYTLSEPPFFDTANMGSYIHASSLKSRGARVKGMICLEMIGFYTADGDSQNYPMPIMGFVYPKKGDYIGIVSNINSSSFGNHVARHMKATALKTKLLKAPSTMTGVDYSDHRNFWKFDYDAVMITDTAFYRNPNYHKETDTMETLDYDRMEEVVKGVCWSALNLK